MGRSCGRSVRLIIRHKPFAQTYRTAYCFYFDVFLCDLPSPPMSLSFSAYLIGLGIHALGERKIAIENGAGGRFLRRFRSSGTRWLFSIHSILIPLMHLVESK